MGGREGQMGWIYGVDERDEQTGWTDWMVGHDEWTVRSYRTDLRN